MKILELLGYTARHFFINVFELVFFIVTVLRRGFSYIHKKENSTLIKQAIVKEVIFDGVDSLVSIVLILSVFIGFGITAQLIMLLQSFGTETEVINIVIHYIAFELSPFMTAIILICRNGSATAIMTGCMTVNKEIKSLELLGVDVLVLFAFPSLIGQAISQVSLSCYFSALSVTSGILFSAALGSSDDLKYFTIFIDSIAPMELLSFLIKNMLFGLMISANASFHGLHAKLSITEVPQRTQKAIMHSIFSIFAISALFII